MGLPKQGRAREKKERKIVLTGERMGPMARLTNEGEGTGAVLVVIGARQKAVFELPVVEVLLQPIRLVDGDMGGQPQEGAHEMLCVCSLVLTYSEKIRPIPMSYKNTNSLGLSSRFRRRLDDITECKSSWLIFRWPLT